MTRAQSKPTRKASAAQARLIAESWGRNIPVCIGGWIDPTIKRALAEGWLFPTVKVGVYPSGHEYREHKVSDEGLYALEVFLFEERCRRKKLAS